MILSTIAYVIFASAPSPCVAGSTKIHVRTDRHQLTLCEGDRLVQTYQVALGQGGVDKTREGDAKTPLGQYSLAAPRPSVQFGTFILIGYPTAAQRKQGLSGGAVGIHGPLREAKNDGVRNVSSDWTLGCIAVADDPSIERIAAWVKAHPDAQVVIE